MPSRVAVVPHIPRRSSVDRVVAAHHAIVAGEPVRAALFEEDVSGDDVFAAGFLGSQALSGAVFGAVGNSLGFVRGVADAGCGRWGRGAWGQPEATEGGFEDREGCLGGCSGSWPEFVESHGGGVGGIELVVVLMRRQSAVLRFFEKQP